MDKFLDRFKPKKAANKTRNAAARLFQPKFSGSGQSLGGAPPGQCHSISITESGSLGVRVECRKNNNSAIVAEVVPDMPAARAGLQRGDLIYYANSHETVSYQDFLKLAKSGERPISFDIRRIQSKLTGATRTADELARKQAVIAAAEQRHAAHQKKTKPIKHVTKSTLTKQQQQRSNSFEEEPLSAASQEATVAAKQSELQTAQELGYNPYQVQNMNASQARTAVTQTTHGNMTDSATDGAPGAVSSPPPLPAAPPEPIDPAFDASFETLSHNDPGQVRDTLKITTKLVRNALKGEDKFQRVRLGNAKIDAAITQVNGAMELVMDLGFGLVEENDELVLVFQQAPAWIEAALERLDNYSK